MRLASNGRRHVEPEQDRSLSSSPMSAAAYIMVPSFTLVALHRFGGSPPVLE